MNSKFFKDSWKFLAGAAVATAACTLLFRSSAASVEDEGKTASGASKPPHHNVLIGDSGGTNVRLQLIRIFPDDIDKKVILKDLTKYLSQQNPSLLEIIQDFLKDVPADSYPTSGVLGIAGPVIRNTSNSTNATHWPLQDGDEIAAKCKMKSFLLINDFVAAGYGVRRLKPQDSTPVGASNKISLQEGGKSVKVVIGPGTGLGQGTLVKSSEDGDYEIFPAEGGHCDFAIKNEEDWELAQFAKKYIEHSNNVENERGKRKVGRLSAESLTAGPAVPLIYEFMKQKHPYMDRVLEKDTQYGKAKKPDALVSQDIINMGVKHKDPLCMKVVEKFTANFGTETGNLALKTMPYGGIYLIGGVTCGIKDYVLSTDTFMKAFADKGRMSPLLSEFKVLLVDPSIELGLLGAAERARVALL